MRATGLLVLEVSGDSTVLLALKEEIKRFFLILANIECKSLHMDLTLSIILD